MSQKNVCRVCGATDPKRWLSSNHDLCSECIETCNTCHGTGHWHGVLGYARCENCRGKGTVAKDKQVAVRVHGATEVAKSEIRKIPSLGVAALAAMACAVPIERQR